MATLTGEELDKIVAGATEWYFAMREFLIESLQSGDYPYGHVKLTQEEQYNQYKRMSGADWTTMVERLRERFRGMSDASQRVSTELTRYRERMEKLGAKLESKDSSTFVAGGR